MSEDLAKLKKLLSHALSGKGAHTEAKDIFEELDWKLAGTLPAGTNHTIFQILNHLVYWQDWALGWLRNQAPPLPRHAAGSWPEDPLPPNEKAWRSAVRHFNSGLEELQETVQKGDLLSSNGGKTPLEMLQTIASHNSYHLGQAALMRQMMHAWPPPSGGLTW